MAAGIYRTTMEKNYPLIATSMDAGQHWVYTLDSSVPNVPPNNYLDNGEFLGVQCRGQNCVAVGLYEASDIPGTLYPLIATSSDSGASWLYTLDSRSYLLPSDYLDSGYWNAVF